LTAIFKDAAGNLAHSYSTVTTADGDTTISAPMMVRVGGDTILAATKVPVIRKLFPWRNQSLDANSKSP
jgi:hypothetical protein